MTPNRQMASYDSANGQLIWEGQAAGKEEIDAAFLAAKEAFTDWSTQPWLKRAEVLKNYATLLRSKIDAFAECISKENGKPLWEAKNEVLAMAGKVDISIAAYEDRCQNKVLPQEKAQSATRFKPHGVVAVLGPFNFPGHLPNGHLVPALLAGNTVIFKPSEFTPLVGEKIVELFKEAGLPQGVLNLVQGGSLTGKTLVLHPDLDGLFFTGSAKTGTILQKEFPFTKILALEMGGNNPLVVSSYDDREAATDLIIQSAYLSSGQRCTCARRLILIEDSQSEKLLNDLTKSINSLSLGTYDQIPEPYMGPVINQAAANHLLQAQDDLKNKGAIPLTWMKRVKENLPLLTPGLMDVTALSRTDEEIFGPFLQLIRVKDFESAIIEANATKFGLSAGLVSKSGDEYDAFWKRVKAGVINWNRPLTGASSKAPFGGIGLSGNHRPSAYLAADYCSYPVASLEAVNLDSPAKGKSP